MTLIQTLRAVISLILWGVVVGLALAAALIHSQPAPDWTIAPCSMQHLPAFTYTDRCVASDGTIIAR